MPRRPVLLAALTALALSSSANGFADVRALTDDAGQAARSTQAAATVEVPGVITLQPSMSVDPTAPSVGISLGVHGSCDALDPAACLLPFPNDRFTVADPSTDTGRRVQLDAVAFPRNIAQVPVDPTEWNRQDGFSPVGPILTYVPGLDLHRTWGTDVDHIADLGRSFADDAPIVVLDATTGQRHPIWSELDQHPSTADGERLLLIRPATEFIEGHRYIVALRDLRDAAGQPIDAEPAFRALRDREPGPAGADAGLDARRAHHEQIFAELTRAGVGRTDLYLAWDFTVASERNLTERILQIRDDAFARLGDTDLADRRIEGRAPAFTITEVTEVATGSTLRNVRGTVQVPNYLTPQAEVSSEVPGLGSVGRPVLDVLEDAGVLDALDPVTGALPIGADDVLTRTFSAPLSRFNTLGSSDGLPVVNPLQPTVDVPFVCAVARTALQSPSQPSVYGHGLLGHRDEATGSSTNRLRERNFTPCAVDWAGFSFADLPNVVVTLLDIGNMPSVVDESQQGMLHALYLGRLMAHPDGLASTTAFQGPDGQPLLRAADLVYNSNSQGAIMGGALTALAPDWERAVLGVPGMGYSTLLNRSIDWEGEYAAVYYAAYPHAVDQQLGYALLQMLWDRSETSGYAQHMTDDPLPNSPTHEAFLQVAFADHQVANVMAEVEARTIGAKLRTPGLLAGRHWASDPTFGLHTVSGDVHDVGSVLVYWFAEGIGLETPPNGNLPPTAGKDPHSRPRQDSAAMDQATHWLRTGDLIDVCGGGPCTIAPPR